MDIIKLTNHVKLCKRNLLSAKVKCCDDCPFEEEITKYFPELKSLFEKKHAIVILMGEAPGSQKGKY